MDQTTIIIFILTSIIINSIAQIVWKKGAKLEKISIKKLIKTILTPIMILGLALYFLSAIIWILVLSNTEVSYAFPFYSIGYILVALLSKIILKEKINTKRITGMIIIILGVIIVGASL